jgi:small subunit ribosomal protein S17
MKQTKRKVLQGIVVSDKMDKTVTVEINTLVLHKKYKKYVKRRVRYKAHDEKNLCKVGNKVIIEATRPLSKTKRWRVVSIVDPVVA